MKLYHEKLGLAAFVLALLGVLTAGLLVIPALICAILSKQAAEQAGLPRDGFATAGVVISGCVLAMWGLLLLTGSVVVLGMGLNVHAPELTMENLRWIILGGGTLAFCLVAAMTGRRLAGAKRMRRLAGRR